MSVLNLQEFPEDIQAECKALLDCLQVILGTDNEARKQAEKTLQTTKDTEPIKYATYITSFINFDGAETSVRALCCVLLRRSLGTNITGGDKTLWMVLNEGVQENIKATLLTTMERAAEKDLIHKLGNVMVEIQGGMYEFQDEAIWQPLLNLIFKFVSDSNATKVDSALQMLNGLFSYIIDHLNKYKTEMHDIFKKTLNHEKLDVKLASLQALSNYLQTVEQVDTKKFQDLIDDMVNVIVCACKEDDETVLQDAWIEFNEIAEIEPKFFQKKMKDIFATTKDIVLKDDFANDKIQQQPIEFYVTCIERIPAIVKKNPALLTEIIQLIFRLMINVDADIEESWLRPKEGFRDNNDDGDEDNVNFGKSSIDKLISAVGDELALPILSGAVNETLQNDSDWRYKNAALMAFSQVGEYIDEIAKISAMVPIVVTHLTHQNPRIRYAALHCIGQISDDMTEDFQSEFGATVLPALIQTLSDPVPRVSAHCSSAITNFMDGAEEELVAPQIEALLAKLLPLIKEGISIQKENSVTAFASTAVAIKTQFDKYFNDSLDVLLNQLHVNSGPEYKQLRAQIIEGITLMAGSVSDEVFMAKSQQIIEAMVAIQTSNMDSKDPQRSYLLSAWQRICLKMKEGFTPYLAAILPNILTMATLKPDMGIDGQTGALDDVLNEITPDSGEKKHQNIMNDDIEEKDSAIQMLIVFIDELGGGCGPFIEQISEIILNLTQFSASDNIRNSAANALPSLIKCTKSAFPDKIAEMQMMAKKYSNNIIEAMEGETETDCLICQAQALKEIIEQAGDNLLVADSVNQFHNKVWSFIDASENRIKDNRKYEQENAVGEEEDDGLDEEDLLVLKEENKNEYQLQLDLGEIIGALFKTHKNLVQGVVQDLLTAKLVPYGAEGASKPKTKFLLFVLDDMIEHLGPDFLGPMYPSIVEQVCKFTNNEFAAIRQAAVYGLGMAAETGGAAFAALQQGAVQGISVAINYQMNQGVKEKKTKASQFRHARDNAVAALGKVLKFQGANVDSATLIPHYVASLPLTDDMEEAQSTNEFFAFGLLKSPETFIGAANERLEQVVIILGTIAIKKQSKPETLEKLAVFISNISNGPAGAAFQALCQKLDEEKKARLADLYSSLNDDVRNRVNASLA